MSLWRERPREAVSEPKKGNFETHPELATRICFLLAQTAETFPVRPLVHVVEAGAVRDHSGEKDGAEALATAENGEPGKGERPGDALRWEGKDGEQRACHGQVRGGRARGAGGAPRGFFWSALLGCGHSCPRSGVGK